MSEKSHDRTEDELKSEICEKVKKLYKPVLYYMGGVDLGKIQEEFSDINKDVILNLLNELVFYDKKLIILDRGIITEYIPKEKLVEIKKDDKGEKKIEDKLKSEIYGKVKRLYEPSLFYVGGVRLEEIRRGFSGINRNVICDLLNELVFCDKKLIIVDRDITTEYIPREKLIEIKKEDKKEKKIKDELKSEIYEVVKRFSAEDELSGYVYPEQVKKEFPIIDEDTIINLLNKLVFCDSKLIRIDGNTWFAYLSK